MHHLTKNLRTISLLPSVVSVLWVSSTPARAAGDVQTTGLNISGQLGNGTLIDSLTPVNVSGLTGVFDVAGGNQHSLAVRSDGTVWGWGSNRQGQLGAVIPLGSVATTPVQIQSVADAIAVAASAYSSYALLTNGTIWGSSLTNIVAIDPGHTVFVALNSNGTVFAGPGSNGEGAGNGITNATAVAAGHFHAMALLNDGTIRAWGMNTRGQVGNGTFGTGQNGAVFEPVQVTGITRAVAIAAGGHHNLALLTDGTLRAWGKNTYGQLGNGTNVDALVPTTVLNATDIVAISAGSNHSMALRRNGEVLAWGSNLYGALGDGTGLDSNVPVPVLTAGSVSSIDCGHFHSLLVVPSCAANIVASGSSANQVDADDLLAVIAAWGQCPQPCPPTCAADLVPNCAVDVSDLLEVISGWGPCP